MEETLTHKSTDTLLMLYDYHSKLYLNAIDGISDQDSRNRLNTKANHIGWIAGSVVHERFQLANFLGIELKQTSHELFKDHKGIQDHITYPSLDEYRNDWKKITPALRKAILELTPEQLDGKDPYGMPGIETLFDAMVAIVDRESYCIGQIGLYRRLLGYEAMKYE